MGSRYRLRQLCETGKVIILIAAALDLLSSCSRPLPGFPQLDLGRLQPEVRKAIEQQADRAKSNPKDPEQSLRLGMILHAHDQFQAAQQCYARAHSLDPKRFETLYYWGHALASTGDYRNSAERLRQAVAIRPGSIPARLKLAEVLRESADTSGSAQLYRQILNEAPDDATAHYGLGRALDGADAIAEFRKALALFPRYGAAQFALRSATTSSTASRSPQDRPPGTRRRTRCTIMRVTRRCFRRSTIRRWPPSTL